MADKKYQIFISSTFKDLKDERLDISRSILDVGHIPAAMENFPAMDEDQLRYIKKVIDQCDYYVLVMAGKYGSPDEQGVSYTEREYDYAKEKGKFILGFPYHDISKLPRESTETDEAAIKKLEAFRAKVMSGRLVRMWTDRRDLEIKVVKAIAMATTEFPQAGWVRTPKESNENLLSEINDLRKTNTQLSNELTEIKGAKLEITGEIADLSDTYEIRIIITGVISASETTGHISLTWHDIFVNIGIYLVGPQLRSDLRKKFASRVAGITFFEGKEVSPQYTAKMPDMTFETVIMQLTVYGLIEIGDDSRIRMSKIGQSTFANAVVVRKK